MGKPLQMAFASSLSKELRPAQATSGHLRLAPSPQERPSKLPQHSSFTTHSLNVAGSKCSGVTPPTQRAAGEEKFEPRFLVFNGKPKGAHRIPFRNGRQRKRSPPTIVAGKHLQTGQTNHAIFRQIHPATFGTWVVVKRMNCKLCG